MTESTDRKTNIELYLHFSIITSIIPSIFNNSSYFKFTKQISKKVNARLE